MLRVVFNLVLGASAAFFVYRTIHWQVMWDPAIMHYVNFLMDHGMRPYRDIIDINLPGSYLVEGWAMHVFGAGDLGWRLYDFFLLTVLTGSLISIALPSDWFAGLYAGVLFLLIHATEGPRNAGQREQAMVTLIVLGYALLFAAIRGRKPLLMLPFGFFIGFAASFKPTAAPLGLLLLLMAALFLTKRKINFKPYLGYGLGGLLAAVLPSLYFLYQHNAFGDFLAISRRLVPYYAGIGNRPVLVLLYFLLPLLMSTSLLAGLVLVLINKQGDAQARWERLILGVGICFGAFSYLAQGKNFEHHAYTFEVFVLFWSALELTRAMRTRGWMHWVGVASIGFGVLVLVPSYCRQLAATAPFTAQPDALKSDLLRLGGSSLQHQVQCLDMVDGCFSTLYRLRLLPNTGFMGDFMFFQPAGSPALPFYRNVLWDDLHQAPPKVIVLTNMWLAEGNSFRKTEQWPELMAYLDRAYTVDVTRISGRSAYRIYVLKTAIKPGSGGTSFPVDIRGGMSAISGNQIAATPRCGAGPYLR